MELTSFLCRCGTPLAAAIGTAGVTCHVCQAVIGVPASPPPPPPPPVPVRLPSGPRMFARIAALASMLLFVLYLAVGLQILGLFGGVARLSGEVSQVISIAGIVGALIAAAGVYESIRAFRGGPIAMIACGVFHLLAGVALLSLDDRHGLGALIGSFLGGPLAHVKNIGMLAIGAAGACIAAGIVVVQARAAQRRAPWPVPAYGQVPPPPPGPLLSPAISRPARPAIDRRMAWIAAGAVAAIAATIAAVVVLRSPNAAHKRAVATVEVDDVAYGYEGGCRTDPHAENRGDPCRAGPWRPVTYMRGGDMLMSGPCWSICAPGEHARPIDMTQIVPGSIECVAGTNHPRGLGSCQVTFKRRIPKQEYDEMMASMAGDGEDYEGDYEEAYAGDEAADVKPAVDNPAPGGGTGIHGAWAGSGSQDHGGYVSTYSVEIEMFSTLDVFAETSRPCGTIRYPSLGCSGVLRCAAGAGAARAETQLAVTEGNCIEGTVTLESTSPGSLSYRWHDPAGRSPDGVGTLSRVR